MEYTRITHPFPPVYDAYSRVLILGSLPSVRSRAEGFFYGHPRNRFWPLLARLLEEPVPVTIEEKRALALRHHIALWDVILSCEIRGSADSSIRHAVPTDLSPILAAAPVRAVFCNGQTAGAYYRRYQAPLTGREAIVLPSTSPANAACSMDRLADAWQRVLPYLRDG